VQHVFIWQAGQRSPEGEKRETIIKKSRVGKKMKDAPPCPKGNKKKRVRCWTEFFAAREGQSIGAGESVVRTLDGVKKTCRPAGIKGKQKKIAWKVEDAC